MGTFTLAELRTEVKAGLGNRTEFVSDNTRIDIWIHKAQTRIARRIRCPELNVLEEHTATYTGTVATDKFIPFSALTNTNPRDILSVRVIDGTESKKLRYVPFRLWDRRIPYPDSLTTGRPSHYTKFQKKLELWRIPSQSYVYAIRMRTWPTALTAAGTASDLDEKDDAIIAMAKYYGFLSAGNTTGRNEAIAEFRDVIKDARLEDLDEPDFDAVEPHVGGSQEVNEYWIDPFVREMPG